MSWRMKLADWISDGSLTRARNDVVWWRDHMVEEIYRPMVDDKNEEIIRIQKNNKTLHELNGLNIQRAARLKIALRAIAAMETPNANATVRRMAKTAREASQ